MFLISCRKVLSPQQLFPPLLAQENVMSNNVSSFATVITINFICLTVEKIKSVFHEKKIIVLYGKVKYV